MNENNAFKQYLSLAKPLFGLILLISFSCANATLPASFVVASVQKMQTYRIQKNDTLWGIANKFRQDATISVEQMMLAILKENPQAFSKGNMHGIKLGYILRMPSTNYIKRINKLQAKAEVKRHADLWKQYQAAASQSSTTASMQPKKTLSSGGGLLGGLTSTRGSSGDKVALLGLENSTGELKNLLSELTSTKKSIETAKQENKSLQDRLIKIEKKVEQVAAKESSPKTIIKYNEAASKQPAARKQINDTQAEEMVLEDEAAMLEEEESPSVDLSSLEPAANAEPTMADKSAANKYDNYSVLLKADKKIIMPGLPGTLTVWIGDENYKPSVSDDKVHDEAEIVAVGDYAVIEPFSTAFVFEPEKSDCIQIHSTGSEEKFELTPQDRGVFEVSVKVNLYNSKDCSTSPVPKSSAILKVTVEVDNKEIVFEKLNELWEIFWEKLLEFWGAFLVVTFGLIMFLYKSKLKALFNFDAGND